MQRNLLSVGHIFLLGSTLLALGGCSDLQNSPWKPSEGKVTPEPSGQTVPPVAGTTEGVTINPNAMPVTGIPKVAKIALLLPLTGKGSDTGQAMLNAAQLAMFDLNASSVFELRPEDTGKGAVQAINSAISNGANLILGPVFSNDTKTISPIALQNNLNIVSFSTDTSAAVGNTFLMGFMPQAQVNYVLTYASSVGHKRIALIAPRDVYGDSVASTFSMFMQRYSLDTAGIIRYEYGNLPTATELTTLKAGVDSILIAASAVESNKISNMLTASGYPDATVKRLGTGLWDQADAAKLSGLQGTWYAASSPRLRTRFEHRYFETYGTQPPRLASLAYDATALTVVLSKSGHGFSRDTLTSPNGFAGVDGIFRFTNDGIADRGLAILEIKNGTSTILIDAPQRFGGL
jgi:ABC-type branched-subunit amino acid transport system substrate-binding protein